jgi:hypothetical protein
MSEKVDEFFKPIGADDVANETTEVESLCVSCGDNVIRFSILILASNLRS